MDGRRRIRSWKQIAAFFSADARTVKRWEAARGLPVHRPAGARAAVFAYEDELEEWMQANDLCSALEDSPEVEPQAGAGQPGQGAEPLSNAPQPSGSNRRQDEARSAARDRPSWVSAFSSRARAALRVAVAPLSTVALAVLLVTATSLLPQQRDFYVPAVKAIGPRTAPPPQPKTPSTRQARSEARSIYLAGLYDLQRDTTNGLRRASREFVDSLLTDPTYVPAYVGLAKAYDRMGRYGQMPPAVAFRLGQKAADRALRLAPDSPAAKTALALSILLGDHDLQRARILLEGAIARGLKSAEAEHVLALALMYHGAPKQALAAIEEARRLDPTSHAILADLARIDYDLGQTGKAMALLRQVEGAAPGFVAPHALMARILLRQHLYRAYLREYRILAVLTGNRARQKIAAAAGAALAQGGPRDFLKNLLDAQKKALADGAISAYEVARTAALMGDRSACRRYLRMARESGGLQLLAIASNPLFSSRQTDGRHLAANVTTVSITAVPPAVPAYGADRGAHAGPSSAAHAP